MAAMSQTILVVDDDPHIRQLLVFALGKAGFETREAPDGEAALELIAAARPDLVVLDINLPRMNGLDVCRRVRARGRRPGHPFPVVPRRRDRPGAGHRTGRRRLCGQTLQPARGGRPGRRRSCAALLAKRRPRTQAGGPLIERGRLSLDPEAWRATWGDQEAPLTVTEFSILRTLAATPAKVFTRDAIIDRLHGPGFALTDRTIDSHIRNLRGKFARIGGHDVVETRAGVGYRLGPCVGAGA